MSQCSVATFTAASAHNRYSQFCFYFKSKALFAAQAEDLGASVHSFSFDFRAAGCGAGLAL